MSMKNNEGVADNHTLNNSITQNTKLLIINYDVVRYHSFDLFRYLLLTRDLFIRLKPEYKPFLSNLEFEHQLEYYRRECKELNPLHCFSGITFPDTENYLEDKLKTMFNDSESKITPTDVNTQFDITFQRKDITGYLLQYADDPFVPSFSSRVKQFKSDSILDMNMATQIICTYNINAVLISSVKLAEALSVRLLSRGYKSPISFIIGNYRYNFTDDNMIQCSEVMNNLEYDYKYEFGLFDPYSGLTYKNKLRSELE